MNIPNPFERRTGPCFVGPRWHHYCAGVLYRIPAPVQPGDAPDKIRWHYGVWRCPCPCGHPERATVPVARP